MVGSHLFNGDKARVGQYEGAFGDAHFADEAFQRVLVLVDRSPEQDRGEVGVNVTAGTENFQQVVLAGEPGEHPCFDVGGVGHIDELVAGDGDSLVQMRGVKGDSHGLAFLPPQ